jgi:hypothetical protein
MAGAELRVLIGLNFGKELITWLRTQMELRAEAWYRAGVGAGLSDMAG